MSIRFVFCPKNLSLSGVLRRSPTLAKLLKEHKPSTYVVGYDGDVDSLPKANDNPTLVHVSDSSQNYTDIIATWRRFGYVCFHEEAFSQPNDRKSRLNLAEALQAFLQV